MCPGRGHAGAKKSLGSGSSRTFGKHRQRLRRDGILNRLEMGIERERAAQLAPRQLPMAELKLDHPGVIKEPRVAGAKLSAACIWMRAACGCPLLYSAQAIASWP